MKASYPIAKYVVFDFETTGFIPGEAEVIQLSAIKFIGEEKFNFNTFVKVDFKLSDTTINLTGITDEILDKKGKEKEVAWREFAEFIKDMPLIGHNSIAFDKNFLEFNYKLFNLPLPPVQSYIDTAMIYKAKKLKESPKWYESHYQFCSRVKEIKAFGIRFNLAQCCEDLNIDVTEFTAHRADSDIEMTNLIYRKFLETY